MNFLGRLWLRACGIKPRNRYEGATYNINRSRINAGVQSARFDASASTRNELVRKSRYFEKNSAIVNRLADLFECYTVGSGLQLNPSSSSQDWNLRAKEWLSNWERNCDLVSRQSFGTLQSLIARAWFVDGEIFIGKDEGDSGRPRLRLYEGHQIATPKELSNRENKTIIDGVALDARGRPAAYYVATSETNNQVTYTRRPADAFIHLYEPGRSGQYRGLPFLYPVINDLHDLDDLQRMEMEAAKIHSTTADIIKTETGELSAEELMRGSSTTSTTDGKARAEYYKDVLGSEVKILQWGDEFQRVQSTRPSVVTREYWQYLTAKVCAGVGIPYVLVFPESMQGTVYRGALDMANAFFKARSLVIADACRRIYEYVMGWAIRFDSEVAGAPQDWNKVSIYPPRSVNVDVGRNSSAMLAELEAGATNYRAIFSPLGLDWREEMAQRKREQEYAEQIGLTLSTTRPSSTDDTERREQDEELVQS